VSIVAIILCIFHCVHLFTWIRVVYLFGCRVDDDDALFLELAQVPWYQPTMSRFVMAES
jgi:hypothetical protein